MTFSAVSAGRGAGVVRPAELLVALPGQFNLSGEVTGTEAAGESGVLLVGRGSTPRRSIRIAKVTGLGWLLSREFSVNSS